MICDWCHETIGHNPDCRKPQVDENIRGEKRWTIKLNKYQRDNLLWLLAAVGFRATEAEEGTVEPFHLANSGDWVGEIGCMLTTVDSPVTTNKSIEELEKQVQHWLVAAKVHLT